MIHAIIDRVEERILVVITHTDPVHTIHLPPTLFPDLIERDVVEISIEKNLEIAQEIRGRIVRLREGLNRVEL